MEIAFNFYDSKVFAVANSGVSFYQLPDENLSGAESVSPQLFLTKDIDANADVRCLAWHPSSEHSDVIAIGQSNGRVSLLSTGLTQSKPHLTRHNSVREFFAKHSRQCNGLAWNPFTPHLLAIGLEKSRSGSMLIWDTNTKYDLSQSFSDKNRIASELNPSPNSQSFVKPLLEAAPGEIVNSLMWLAKETLIAGFNKKYIRMYDIRIGSSTSSVIAHKATCGLCLNPHNKHWFACYGEDCIAVWDSRFLQKPNATIPVTQRISKIEWSRTRKEMLGTLFVGSSHSTRVGHRNPSICVYDMMNATHSDQDLPANYPAGTYLAFTKSVKLNLTEEEWVAGFAWIPDINNILTVSNASSFNLSSVPENTSISWRTKNSFGVACGYNSALYHYDGSAETSSKEQPADRLPLLQDDLTEVIHRRVRNGYGLSEDDFLKNIDLSLQPHNDAVHFIWRWIAIVKEASKEPPQTAKSHAAYQSPSHWSKSKSVSMPSQLGRTKRPNLFAGVQAILREDGRESSSTTAETVPWIGVPNTKSQIYTSWRRKLALMVCGWGSVHVDGKGDANRFGRNSVGEDLVRRLQKSGATERACAVAVWHLDVILAIEILNLSQKRKGSAKYSSVAMALSGYTGMSCPTLWLDTCRRLQNELESAYLQMAFAFLIACADENKTAEPSTGKFNAILSNPDILLEDRIAFACMYLTDLPLNAYINRLSGDLIAKGDLKGILVVGLSTNAGVELLQNYLDKTNDIQTPLLAVLHTNHTTMLQVDPHIQHWRESYRNLLNKWQLYFERVDFDLLWNKACSINNTSSQVYLHCNYCNKTISHTLQPNTGRSRHHSTSYVTVGNPKEQGFGGALTQQNAITSCPFCRKPLPRCSVCSMHLGTRQDETDISKWITWCMKCRHGGHQGHMKEWFESHIQCPVTDCKCFCNDDLPIS